MPKILPPTNRPRVSGLDNKTKIRLVTDALIEAASSAKSNVLTLIPTEENKLNRLQPHEIVQTLAKIAVTYDRPFEIDRSIQPSQTILGHLAGKSFGSPGRPITLRLFNNFQNWCEAERHKQSVSIETLTEDSREKVARTVGAIYEQFELSADPKVTIRWRPSNILEDAAARRHALTFLTHKDVVERYEFKYGEVPRIEIEINIGAFLEFRKKLIAYSSPSAPSGAEAPDVAIEPPKPSNAFVGLENLKWEDIKIRFVDGHNVKVSARGTEATINYKEMGFEDGRKLNPNKQWQLLESLAENQGQISWSHPRATLLIKKTKQRLSKALRDYFGIAEDPFQSYKKEGVYRIRISLLLEQ